MKLNEKVIKEAGEPIRASNGDEAAYKLTRKAVVEFFRKNPNPTDKQLHTWAHAHGHDPSDVEDIVYKLTSHHVKMHMKKSETEMVEHLQQEGLHKKDHVMKVDPKELALGIKVELEHTPSQKVAREIALDHLHEDPKYYTHLEAIEEKHVSKAVKMAIGTISRGRKKMAEGKWIPVKAESPRTLPQDVSELTVDIAAALIAQTSRMPLDTIRKNQAIVTKQQEMAYEQKNTKALKRLNVMESLYTAAVDIKEFKDSTPRGWAKQIVANIKKSRTEGVMGKKKSGIALVIIPGELTKAANLKGVGGSAKHPAGLSKVQGNTKSKIPYTSHTERMALAKMAADRMLAPKPGGVNKVGVGTSEVDRKGREKDKKPPHSNYSTGVSGEGSQAHDNFGRQTVIVSPTEIGASKPESASKYGGVKKVAKPRS